MTASVFSLCLADCPSFSPSPLSLITSNRCHASPDAHPCEHRSFVDAFRSVPLFGPVAC
jgi:hypothetical protein